MQYIRDLFNNYFKLDRVEGGITKLYFRNNNFIYIPNNFLLFNNGLYIDNYGLKILDKQGYNELTIYNSFPKLLSEKEVKDEDERKALYNIIKKCIQTTVYFDENKNIRKIDIVFEYITNDERLSENVWECSDDETYYFPWLLEECRNKDGLT